jgi:hypothetical protein
MTDTRTAYSFPSITTHKMGGNMKVNVLCHLSTGILTVSWVLTITFLISADSKAHLYCNISQYSKSGSYYKYTERNLNNTSTEYFIAPRETKT